MASNASDIRARVNRKLVEFHHDPLAWVLWAFPWNSGELSGHTGPRKWQREVLETIAGHLRDGATVHQALQTAVASGHGIGKGHCLETRVETPTGQRRWGDLVPGDVVFSSNGSPTRITETRRYIAPVRRVHFDDGTFTDVSDVHLWSVRGRQERRTKRAGWRTLETRDIERLGVKRPNGTTTARQWEIPIQGAAQFPATTHNVHPYAVGLWLSDGSRGTPIICKPFPEIPANLRALGYEVASSDRGTHRLLHVAEHFKSGVFACESHDRYIPNEFKYDSIENRMALFRGLCDGDGEVHGSGSIGYASTSRQLATDVVWLARSLGCKAQMQPSIKHGWYPDGNGGRVECRDCWRVTINAPFNPFSLLHRKNAYKASRPQYQSRWIDRIEALPDAEGMCISVEASNGLYQANDFIVTHNSALVSWIILWSISTSIDTRGVVTANTESQLRTKTWPELSKWHRLSLMRESFTMTATAIYSSDAARERTWRIDAIPWSESNTEAFAGLHNQGKRVLLVYDEASAIPDKIFEVSEGALTDARTEMLWFIFGNPTRNTGRFRECFGRLAHRWKTKQIDSRTVEGTAAEQFAKWIEDYGEDSDFARVRVRGQFPRAGSMQFISSELVSAAMNRVANPNIQDPVAVGVDVARFGDDESVMWYRCGKDARTVRFKAWRGLDTMQLAASIAGSIEKVKAHGIIVDAIFVDETGVGGGVIDRLRQMGYQCLGVNNGAKSDWSIDGVLCANKAAEMWARGRQWLQDGGALPPDDLLRQQLEGREYGYNVRNEIVLERKADMKKRGLSSPDRGDAFLLTFAYPIAARDHLGQRTVHGAAKALKTYSPLDAIRQGTP